MFEFKPNFFLVRHESFLNLFLYGNAILTKNIVFQVNNNNLTWYSTINQSEQNNTLGTRYYYAASVASAPETRIGTFYFDYQGTDTFNFVIGMTWEEFVNSHYNVNNTFVVSGNHIKPTANDNLVLGLNNTDVQKTDYVQDLATYRPWK